MPLTKCPMCGEMISSNVTSCPNCGGIIKKNTEFKKTNNYNLILTNCGNQKIKVIKKIRDITGWGLAEAKGAVDNVPSIIQENINNDIANQIKNSFEELGAEVNIVSSEEYESNAEINSSHNSNNSQEIICPNCHSTNVNKIGGKSKTGLASLFSIFTKDKASKTYECKKCGNTW